MTEINTLSHFCLCCMIFTCTVTIFISVKAESGEAKNFYHLMLFIYYYFKGENASPTAHKICTVYGQSAV